MKTSRSSTGRVKSAVAAICLSMAAVMPVGAVQPDEVLDDPALEARARAISAHLRCLVCQNQSIDDSNAPLAKDLRLLVRERLKAKDSDEAVLEYVVQRYGDFVLLRPPFKMSTLLLWLSPLIFLAGAIWLVMKAGFGRATREGGDAPAPLTKEEQTRLDELLKKED